MMRRIRLPWMTAVLAVTVLFVSSPRHSDAAGVNLSWDACGAAGSDVETFACNTNTGSPFTMTASFVPPAGIAEFLGLNADLRIASTALPDWWKHGSGQCRSTGALSVDLNAAPTGACASLWPGTQVSGFEYAIGGYGPNTARLRVTGAVPIDQRFALSASNEYQAFQVNVQPSRSTGAGSCAGCSAPVRVTLENIQLFQPPEAGNDPVLSAAVGRSSVVWQSSPGNPPSITSVTPMAGAPGLTITIDGAGFTSASSVQFGGRGAGYTVDSDTRIIATVPDDGRSGPITVVTPLGTTASASSFTVAPAIAGFLPKQAPVGADIQVRGANYTGASSVLFNGTAAIFSVLDDSTLTAAVPAGATSGPLSIGNAGGTTVSDSVFRVGPVQGAVNLAWNDCGPAGASIQGFACNANSGPGFTLVGSFVPPPGVDALIGMNADIGVYSAQYPDWWKIGAGQCRGNVLSSSMDFTAASGACLDPWLARAGGGSSFTIDHYGPGTGRIQVVGSMPVEYATAVSPHHEYYGFKVLMSRLRTVSDGACAGCDLPVRLTLHRMQLIQTPASANDPVLTLPYQSNSAYWQAVPGPLPAIAAMNPTAGAPGTVVTLTGTAFTGATSVKLGPLETVFTLVSDTEIQASVPANGRTNPFSVRTPSGTGGSDSVFIVRPRVDSFLPGQAPEGTSIAVRGINFLRSTAVAFNGLAATFTLDNDSLLHATVPAGATSGPISVTNPGGTAASGEPFVVGPLLPGTMNLSWNDCGNAGGALETFACNTNTGTPFVAIASFEPPPDIVELVGITGEIRVSAFASLPDWWKHGTGQCRGTTGLTPSMNLSGAPSACPDPWAGRVTSATVTHTLDAYGPGTARIFVSGAISSGAPSSASPGTEYHGFKIAISRAASTGSGSCAGCDAPVSLELEQMQLLQSAPLGYDPVITTPRDNATIQWQAEPGPPPVIASFTPGGGPGGTVVTIAGSNFTGASTVRFGGAAASFSVESDTEIQATAPANVRTAPITVFTPRGGDTSDSLYLAPPVIQFLVPRQAPIDSQVTLRGFNFTRVASVTFDGTVASFEVPSDSLLRATVPAGATDGPIIVAHAFGADTTGTDFLVGPVLEGAVNLSWVECGTAGNETQTFDCATTLGSVPLVASFQPASDVQELYALSGEIRVESTGPLPDWWKHGSGHCRGTTALTPSVNFPTPAFTACSDFWAGRSGSASLAYEVGYDGPHTARVHVNAAMPLTNRVALSPATQYYAFMLNVSRAPTACAGCSVPVALSLTGIRLFQSPDLEHDPFLTVERDRKTAFWQAEPGPAPAIASFTPAAGAPGTIVTIEGSHFSGATDVRFAQGAATFEVDSDSRIRAAVPPNARTGRISVTTVQGTGTSADSFIVAPRIVSFAPRQAPAGHSITIRGQNFGHVTDVEFNGLDADGFTVVTDSSLYATVPAAATTGPIRVANPGGDATSTEDFVVGPLPPGFINLAWNDCGPAGSSIQPFACNSNSGSPFSLVASFVPPGGVTEMFGLSGEIRVVANTTELPNWWKHGTGQCRSTGGLSTSFDFQSGPSTCEDFWQGRATGGHTYEIGFGGANAARLVVTASIPYGERAAVDPSSEYYAFKVLVQRSNTTGSGACTGCAQGLRLTLREIQLYQAKPLNFDPVITTPHHSRDAYWQFIPGPPPVTTDFTPRVGGPGTPVTIFGQNFTGTSSVRFGPAAAPFTVTSDTRIDCTVPVGARSGPIEITTLQGSALTDSIFVAPPEITGFAPNPAPVGHEIAIFGANFLRTTAVSFNGVAASFQVLDNTGLRATVPPGVTTGPVRVDNPAGFDVSAMNFTPGPVTTGTGINLAWDDCGLAGTQDKGFACNTNTGVFTLIASFVPPAGVNEFLGLDAQIDIRSQSPALPDWWKHGSSQCRGTTGLSVSFDFTAGPFTCVDFFTGQAAGGFLYEYPTIPTSGDRARIRVVCAVPFDNRGPIEESVEYYAFKILMPRSRTTGTGSCSGCDVPVCIGLDNIRLYQPPDRGFDPFLTNPIHRNFVSWQGAFTCQTSTPVQVSLVSSEASSTGARVVWQLEGVEMATVYRREGVQAWQPLATVIPDGQRRIAYDDADVVPGATYSYRLGFVEAGQALFAGETEVRIPAATAKLAVHGVRQEAGAITVSLALAGAAEARVEIYDLVGRRWAEQRLDGLGAGDHEIRIAGPRPLTSGVYFARVLQQGASASRRFVVVK